MWWLGILRALKREQLMREARELGLTYRQARRLARTYFARTN